MSLSGANPFRAPQNPAAREGATLDTPTLPTTTAEPEFLTWLQYAGDDALKTWGRHRLAEPVAHFVYLRWHASGALYVGITRIDQLKHRMRTHDRNATRDALPDAPSEFYSWCHGQGELIDLRFVPDKVAALLLEAEATCALAAAGYEVFGSWPGARMVARSSLVGSKLGAIAAWPAARFRCCTRFVSSFASRGAAGSVAKPRRPRADGRSLTERGQVDVLPSPSW